MIRTLEQEVESGVSAKSEPLLELDDVRHQYGARTVLDGVGLRLTQGEIVGLLSPNGGGKSTILAWIAGLLGRKHGRLAYCGRSQNSDDRPLRENLGVVFQHPSLDLKLSAHENLKLALRMHGIGGVRARKQLNFCLELAQLEGRDHEPLRKLSGGMRRRVDVARAIVHQPRLLLLDEPTTGLDEGAFRRVWAQIHELRRSMGVAVIVATHRPDEAEHCDRLIVLHQGKVVANESPSTLVGQLDLDLVRIRGVDPEAIIQRIEERLQMQGKIEDGEVVIGCKQGHLQIPRIAEQFRPGSIDALSVHRPTLADVFVQLTGSSLHHSENIMNPGER